MTKEKTGNKDIWGWKVLRPGVFFPATILLLLTVILNLLDYEAFVRVTTTMKDFMVVDMGWLFSIAGVLSLILIVTVYFSPLGNIRLGGAEAKPILSKPSWFAVTLCTTIAAGILFWGTAEPMWHLAYPPASLGIEPMSPEAAQFAMETMYLHWTFIPYALYAVPTIVFAFAYYNMNRSFSVGSQIAPLVGVSRQEKLNGLIDSVVLLTVAAGIASSFGTAVMNMGATERILGAGEQQVSLDRHYRDRYRGLHHFLQHRSLEGDPGFSRTSMSTSTT
jgi:glycine betaine transporter